MDMTKVETLEEILDDFDCGDLPELDLNAELYFNRLMDGELEGDEDVYEELLTFLVIQLYRYRELSENARDLYEERAFASLRDMYEAILRVPESVEQHAFTYCNDQAEHCFQKGKKEESRAWGAIAESVRRVVAR